MFEKDPLYWKIRNDAFNEGQRYNNIIWATKVKNIAKLKGIGEKRFNEICDLLEQPLSEVDQKIADTTYREIVKKHIKVN